MTRRHPDAKPPFRQPDDQPDGRPSCRWCWGPVPKGNRTWCSRACVDEYKDLHDWQHIIRKVEKRDHGICALCGCDTEKLQRVLRWSKWMEQRSRSYAHDSTNYRVELFGTRRGGYRFTEIDHITPREHGGTNELANLRTLCVGCHRDVTARQARAKAAKRWVLNHPAFG